MRWRERGEHSRTFQSKRDRRVEPDQSLYSCSSPTDGGGDDLENLAASSSLQEWFDMEVLGAHVCDNLDAIATTE